MATGSTSIWGRPYPLSTDAPNVHSDIQALANSLETTPLYPTTAVTSRTGIAGESVLVSANQTLTLPAAPAKGDTIQVIAGAVTPTTPVTVAAAGSKVINGKGLSSAASFPLGAVSAHATLQYDGTAWRVTHGAQDSGWVSLTPGLTTGWLGGSSGGYTDPAYRLVANEVKLRGLVKNNTGAAQGAGVSPLSIAFPQPPYEIFGAMTIVGTGALCNGSIGLVGGIEINSGGSVPNGDYLSISCFAYDVD